MIDESVVGHRKTRWLERELGEENATVVGRLTKIWLWSLSSAEDGFVEKKNDWLLEDAAGWTGDSGRLIKALVKVGFLERNSAGYALHDWENYGGRVIKARDAARERSQKGRDRMKACGERSANVRRTSATNVGSNEVATNVSAQEAAHLEQAASAQERKGSGDEKNLAALNESMKQLPEDLQAGLRRRGVEF